MPYPYVSNEGAFGSSFLDAFMNAYGLAGQRKRQKEQDEIDAEDRERQREIQDATLASQGLFRGTAPVEAPAPPMASRPGEGFRSAFVAEQPRRPGATPFDEIPSRMGRNPMEQAISEMATTPPAGGDVEAPPQRPPGSFDPMTMSFTPAVPRYRQVTPGIYEDATRTPEGRKAVETERERARVREMYQRLGLTTEQAALAAEDEAYGRELLTATTTPKDPTRDEQIRKRIRELTTGGMTLRAANEQARLEFGGAVGEDKPTGSGSPQAMQQAIRLATQYSGLPVVKNATTIAENLGTVIAASQDPSAAGDLALIFGYMKLLDPGSTVREGEFANAQNAAGVPDQVRNAWNRAMSGERLNEAQRRDFAKQAMSKAESQRKILQPFIDRYSTIAQRYGIDPFEVVFDPFDTVLASVPPSSNPW